MDAVIDEGRNIKEVREIQKGMDRFSIDYSVVFMGE